MSARRSTPLGRLTRDVTELPLIGRAVRLRLFQLWMVLPTLAAVAVVLASTAVGMDHPSVNFGTVFTWVVWWGGLLFSLVLVGRAWCLVCPLAALGEWLQRSSLGWRSSRPAGLGLRWPRPLRPGPRGRRDRPSPPAVLVTSDASHGEEGYCWRSGTDSDRIRIRTCSESDP
ncbi:MAG: 4Fe-4S binding protein [Candidatus Rokubacteria bacterium]|nr:4Fe-4S binding protein [Candidatus Rokubacteria bacterium]